MLTFTVKHYSAATRTRGEKKTSNRFLNKLPQNIPSPLGALRPEAAVVSTQLHWCIMYDFPFPPTHTIPSKKKKKKKKFTSPTSMVCKWVSFQMKRQLLLGSIQNPSIYIIAITISSIRNPSFASLDSERVGWHVVVAAVILGFVRSLNQVHTIRPLPVPHSGLRAAGGTPIINSINSQFAEPSSHGIPGFYRFWYE